MTDATPTQGAELIALARKCGASRAVGNMREHLTFDRAALEAFAAALRSPGQQAGEPSEWRPIETAPKHTEVLVWREDSGPFIAKLTTPDAVITPEEMERENLEFPHDFEEWFSDAYGWQEGAERPTHWMRLPEAPARVSIDIREDAA